MSFQIRKLPFFSESWNVAWRKASPGSILQDKATPFCIIENPLRYWAADPFVVEKDGKTYIFAELYDYIRCRGILGVCELIPGQKCRWEPIITEPFHLSYPCILEQDGKIYMMPESGQQGALLLYEAVEFPRKWKKIRTLRENICLADTTPMTRTWFLAHLIAGSEEPRLTLIDPMGQRPDMVVEGADPLRSRPAGKPFLYGSEKYRPVQHSLDFFANYGKSLVFARWELDENGYREEAVCEIFPECLTYSRPIFLDGIHTYNASPHFEVIDIKTRRFNLLNLMFRFLCKCKRFLQIHRR